MDNAESALAANHWASRPARALNDGGIPCPSAADPDRNPHRPGQRWTLTTVRAILANPRYTGRQVWNRQRTDHDLIDPDNTSLGHRDVMRWNVPEDWVISSKPAHPALVSETDFVAAQSIRAPRETAPGRTYQLAGLLRCGLCERRMESHWARCRPAYRCRHGHSSAAPRDPSSPRNSDVREDEIVPHLPALLVRMRAGGLPPSPEEALEYLRAEAISLIFDADARTLTAATATGERVAIS